MFNKKSIKKLKIVLSRFISYVKFYKWKNEHEQSLFWHAPDDLDSEHLLAVISAQNWFNINLQELDAGFTFDLVFITSRFLAVIDSVCWKWHTACCQWHTIWRVTAHVFHVPCSYERSYGCTRCPTRTFPSIKHCQPWPVHHYNGNEPALFGSWGSLDN